MSNDYWPLNVPRNRYRRYKNECKTAVYCDHLHSIGLWPFVESKKLIQIRKGLFISGLSAWFKEMYRETAISTLFSFNAKL